MALDAETPHQPDDDRPVDPPPAPDPEAVTDAPETAVDDADRPTDDTEFWFPGEQEGRRPSDDHEG